MNKELKRPKSSVRTTGHHKVLQSFTENSGKNNSLKCIKDSEKSPYGWPSIRFNIHSLLSFCHRSYVQLMFFFSFTHIFSPYATWFIPQFFSCARVATYRGRDFTKHWTLKQCPLFLAGCFSMCLFKCVIRLCLCLSLFASCKCNVLQKIWKKSSVTHTHTHTIKRLDAYFRVEKTLFKLIVI